jgi:cyclopropane fatty-acyl-phospholipid synthase-like methyltransferase
LKYSGIDMMKPNSPSCLRNQAPILAQLLTLFANSHHVLEIASGTGQHAVYLGQALPHLTWQTSDLPEHHAGIQAWLDEALLPNVLSPLALDVNQPDWGVDQVDAVFNANTVHIVSWPSVCNLFAGVARVLVVNGVLCLYGPFNYGGNYTSDSNAEFDSWLKARDPASGIRDFESICELAASHGLVLREDIAMPSNNRLLVFIKH